MTDEPTQRTALLMTVNPEETEGVLCEVESGRVVLSLDLTHPFAPVVAAILLEGLAQFALSEGIPMATFDDNSVQ